MNYFLLFHLVFAVILDQNTCIEHHSDETYPFLVKIEAKGKILDCAGTILTPCTVLTSAHCVEGVDASQVTVSQITTTVFKHGVASTVIHPKYNSTVLANDIALLQIEKKFHKPWAAVSLNNVAKEEVFPKCNSFQILGWSGQIMKAPLKKVAVKEFVERPMKASVKLISNENCSTAIKNLGGIFQGDEKLCGVSAEEGEEEGCFTGPGGPLLCSLQSQGSMKRTPKRDSQFQQDHFDKKGILEDPIDLLENFGKSDGKKFKREVENNVPNLQVGVVSWGKSCSKVPSVYVKTDSYIGWIIQMAKGMTEKCAPEFKMAILSSTNHGDVKISDVGSLIFSVTITVLLRFLWPFISVDAYF